MEREAGGGEKREHSLLRLFVLRVRNLITNTKEVFFQKPYVEKYT